MITPAIGALFNDGWGYRGAMHGGDALRAAGNLGGTID